MFSLRTALCLSALLVVATGSATMRSDSSDTVDFRDPIDRAPALVPTRTLAAVDTRALAQPSSPREVPRAATSPTRPLDSTPPQDVASGREQAKSASTTAELPSDPDAAR